MTPKTQIIYQGAEAKIILKDNSVIKNRISKSYRIKELDEKIRKQRTRSETKLLNKASEVINTPKPLTEKNTASQINRLKINKKTSVSKANVTQGGGRGCDGYQIIMPFIDGKKLSEYLDSFPLKKQKQICKQIGESIAKLHNANIIHGDLTTSNMILVEDLPAHSRSQIDEKDNQKDLLIKNSKAKKSGEADFGATNRASVPIIFFIDFGLGYISRKFEDKAVDLHLLKQALEAKHFKNWEVLFDEFLKGYCKLPKGGVGGAVSKDSKIVLERLKAVEKRGRYKH